MNIVLIGYRGVGKSSVAKMLATRLSRPVFSTDEEIVKRTNLPIPDLVKQFGWDYFRDLESEVCLEVANRDGLVLDTGGGLILRPQNVQALKAHGILFWLTAEAETVRRRIGGDTQRPSLTGTKSFTEEIEDVMRERRPKYEAAADHVIATDHCSLSEVADAIVDQVEQARTG
ncbi:MAG TPA: shikimate kinase [Nitrospiraceae bacterium]|nr:shikimate kinase [Nitrospiraceae bacterium]